MTTETTICHILKPGSILLKMASRGISKGKWNAPGGRIEKGETPEQNARREVLEETGLKVSNLFLHGELYFFAPGKKEPNVHSYLFSTSDFSGDPRSSDEGEVRWFDISKIPYDQMWADDLIWWPLMLHKKKFDADFYFDEADSRIIECKIRFRE
jgi:8-oxo-dGTP pyrophosphatase MutT (NUDIX family)